MARWFSFGGGLKATQRLRHDVMGAMEPREGEMEEEKGETYLNFSDVTDAILTINPRHLNVDDAYMVTFCKVPKSI